MKSCRERQRPARRSSSYIAKRLDGLEVTRFFGLGSWRWKVFGIWYFSQILTMSSSVIVEISYISVATWHFPQRARTSSSIGLSEHSSGGESSREESWHSVQPRSCLLNDSSLEDISPMHIVDQRNRKIEEKSRGIASTQELGEGRKKELRTTRKEGMPTATEPQQTYRIERTKGVVDQPRMPWRV